jgi:predicted dehydrogenase
MPANHGTVRWAVIGATGIADRRTIPEGIMPAANSELVALMAIPEVEADLQRVSEKYGAPYFTDAEKMLESVAVDAAYLACPPAPRPEYARICAEAGVHVLAEKPLARTVPEAEALVAVCHEHGVKLGTAFMMPFHHLIGEAIRLVAEGALGPVVSARVQFGFDYPPTPGAFRQIKSLAQGGAFMDVGNHSTDILERIVGTKVASVMAMTANVVHEYEGVEDTCAALYRLENGALGIVDTSFATDGARNDIEINGAQRTMLVRGMIGQGTGGVLQIVSGFNGEQVELEIVSDGRNMYVGEISAFAEAIVHDTTPPITGEDGLWSQRIVEAVYRSAETNCLATP